MVVGPILSQTMSDVFCDNENGPNFLFKNNGDGTFVDKAKAAGVYDRGGGALLFQDRRDVLTYLLTRYCDWN